MQKRGCCDAGREARGNDVGLCCRRAGVFGVGGRAEPDDAVAGFEGVELAGTGGDDGAFGFAAEDFGFRGGVETCAEIALLC